MELLRVGDEEYISWKKITKSLMPDQGHLVLDVLGFVERVNPSPPVDGWLPDEPEEVESGECLRFPSPSL